MATSLTKNAARIVNVVTTFGIFNTLPTQVILVFFFLYEKQEIVRLLNGSSNSYKKEMSSKNT